MNRLALLARALVSRRWWWVTLLVLALMAVLARLGFWQLARLEERRAANMQLAAALASAPIPLNDELTLYSGARPDQVPEDLANRDVLMVGTYDFDQQRILKLQSWNGQPGVHLITPLVLEEARDSGESPQAVLVDRGWIPDAEREAGHAFESGGEAQTVRGYIALTETISRRTAEAVVPVTPGDELFRVDIAAIQNEMPYRLAPFYVKAAPPQGTDQSLPIEVPKEVDLSEGPHLSYAAQWFIFSLGLGIGYLVLVYRSLSPQSKAPHL